MCTIKMIQREDVAHLFKSYGLLGIEVDERHIAMFNYMYTLGIEAGKARAKAALEWRISGPLMVKMIEDDICP